MRIHKAAIHLFLSVMIIGSSYSSVLAGGEDHPDAAELFESKCSICHAIDRPKNKRKSEKGWRSTVMRMKNSNGCPITDEEAELIIKYLSETYGK